jgi:hypothetical protein
MYSNEQSTPRRYDFAVSDTPNPRCCRTFWRWTTTRRFARCSANT